MNQICLLCQSKLKGIPTAKTVSSALGRKKKLSLPDVVHLLWCQDL